MKLQHDLSFSPIQLLLHNPSCSRFDCSIQLCQCISPQFRAKTIDRCMGNALIRARPTRNSVDHADARCVSTGLQRVGQAYTEECKDRSTWQWITPRLAWRWLETAGSSLAFHCLLTTWRVPMQTRYPPMLVICLAGGLASVVPLLSKPCECWRRSALALLTASFRVRG